MITLTCDLSAVHRQLTQMGDAAATALRQATFEGANLVYQAARVRAPMSAKWHYFYSRRRADGSVGQKYRFESGSLKQSIYIKYVEEEHRAGEYETYQISWRKQSSALGYVPYAHMVEYGTVYHPPRPFVRPAFDATRAQAEQLIINTILQAIQSSC